MNETEITRAAYCALSRERAVDASRIQWNPAILGCRRKHRFARTNEDAGSGVKFSLYRSFTMHPLLEAGDTTPRGTHSRRESNERACSHGRKSNRKESRCRDPFTRHTPCEQGASGNFTVKDIGVSRLSGTKGETSDPTDTRICFMPRISLYFMAASVPTDNIKRSYKVLPFPEERRHTPRRESSLVSLGDNTRQKCLDYRYTAPLLDIIPWEKIACNSSLI